MSLGVVVAWVVVALGVVVACVVVALDVVIVLVVATLDVAIVWVVGPPCGSTHIKLFPLHGVGQHFLASMQS